MRRRDCEFNLDISMRQQTPSDDNKMRILERRAAVAYCGHTVRHCTRASYSSSHFFFFRLKVSSVVVLWEKKLSYVFCFA